MRTLLLALTMLCTGQVLAQQVNLKCTLTFLKDGTQSETWIVVDPVANYMRVNGVARPLTMSNDRYSSSQQIGAFTKITAIDRNTGEINVSSLYEGQVVLPYRGSCEKAAPPPAAKF
ncbi:hypothetical protein ACSFA8_20805 [Variovorax sp. RT4R15]|uniref:hypothetical protein n=1 Tax=Variovorax sp. RT4R15 TaxID=3443737 RepID=UPI003F44A5AF